MLFYCTLYPTLIMTYLNTKPISIYHLLSGAGLWSRPLEQAIQFLNAQVNANISLAENYRFTKTDGINNTKYIRIAFTAF